MGNTYSKSKSFIVKEQNHKVEYKASKNPWLDTVIKKKGFEVTDVKDKGIVTAKLGVKLPQSSKQITVIVWKTDYIENRLFPWRKFHNKNVMPLLYTETISSENAVLIYTISPDTTLQQKVYSKEFRGAKNALDKIVLFLIDAIKGLNYVHEQGYAHLNVKSTSIALFKDGTVKLDQFHFLNPQSNSSR